MTNDELDLKTLIYIKYSFDFCSDGSTNNIGYKNLCILINDLAKKHKVNIEEIKDSFFNYIN